MGFKTSMPRDSVKLKHTDAIPLKNSTWGTLVLCANPQWLCKNPFQLGGQSYHYLLQLSKLLIHSRGPLGLEMPTLLSFLEWEPSATLARPTISPLGERWLQLCISIVPQHLSHLQIHNQEPTCDTHRMGKPLHTNGRSQANWDDVCKNPASSLGLHKASMSVSSSPTPRLAPGPVLEGFEKDQGLVWVT